MTTHPTSWTSDLDARYELLEEAGRGGMGVVYKARDRETGEIVALKILKPEIAADRGAAERFLNEVRLSRRITHKNVTRVYEFTRAGSTAYLSMEYVEGESLRSIVDRIGAVNLRKGVQIARQICAALFEAHSQGIVHRDLKPENVMLDRAGNVKVMDFGIARLLDTSVTATAGGIIGTPAYMAPEQAEGKDVDQRTDIYAAGLILYEIFTGRAAFTGDTPMVVALKQIRETPAAPRTIEPSVSPELDAIILRCLEKDPANRFQSIEELDAALATLVGGATTTGPLLPDPSAHATGAATWPMVAGARTTPLGQQTDTSGAAAPHGTSAVTSAQPAVQRAHADARLRPRAWFIAVLAVVVLAAAAVAYVALRPNYSIPFETFTLSNGLEVILAQDRSAPTVAVAVTYKVGAKDDPAGREGLAHLFEHMMFNGSLNVGKGEHHHLVMNQGGTPNGSAYIDHTQVWETLPANQLELALFLEADRMRSLRLDGPRIETERGTVIAERQQRVENQPYGGAMDALYALAYDVPNYKKHYIGTDAGLRAISAQEINDFFRIFYAPNNAILTVVGDFDTGDARARIENYFQHIPAQPPAPDVDLSEPEPTAERRHRIEDPFATSPRTYIGYKLPRGTSREHEALIVLYAVLAGDSGASRLHQKLVKELEAAVGVGGTIELRKGPGFLTFVMQPAAGRDEPTLLNAFDEVLGRLQSEGIDASELERIKTRVRLTRANARQGTATRALLLGEYQAKFGNAAFVNERDEWLESLTPADVQQAARTLRPERRSILTVVRGGSPTPGFTSATTVTPVPSERFNRAPVSKDVLRVDLPRATESKLPNGLTMVVAEDRRAPLISARIEVRGAGTLDAPADNPAVAIAAAAMLREGTRTRSSRQIAEALDEHGANITLTQPADSSIVVLNATGLSETFAAWFPIVADVVMNATFPADELTVLNRRLASEWQARRAAPLTIALEVFDEAVYGPVAGRRITPDAFTRVSSDTLRAWHQERYVPQNVTVSIAGAADRGDIERVVRQSLEVWTPGTAAAPSAAAPRAERARVLIVDRPGSVQTTLMAGVQSATRAHPDYLPLTVVNRVLGGAANSRLFVRLRDELGLTFGAFSQVSAYGYGGDWRAWTEIRSGGMDQGVEAFLQELRRMNAESIATAELDDAKRAIVASFALTLEQLPQLVGYMATRTAYGLSTDYWDRFPEKVMAVTPDDARKAGQYLDFSRIQIVAVGDAARLRALLAPFGEVTIIQ